MKEDIVFSQEQLEIVMELSKLSVDEIKALRKIAREYIKEQNAEEDFETARNELINELIALSETDPYVNKNMITGIVNHFSNASSSSLPYILTCMSDNLYTIDKIKKIKVINVTRADMLGLITVYKITMKNK